VITELCPHAQDRQVYGLLGQLLEELPLLVVVVVIFSKRKRRQE